MILRKCLHIDHDIPIELCKIHQYLSAGYLFWENKLLVIDLHCTHSGN